MPGGDARPTAATVREAVSGTRFADLRWVAETGSTNQDLMALAAAGAPEGVVLVADHQTSGRGRLGRVWTAPPAASLLLSVLLRPPLELGLGSGHALTTTVALAGIDACVEVAGVRPGLKWPNDLVIASPRDGGAERKLAGVLAESSLRGDRFDAVVVGIGVNLNWPADLPAEIDGIAVALNHVARAPVDRAVYTAALLQALDRRYSALLEPGGPEALRRDEEAASATLGRTVRVIRSHDELEGIAVGLDPDGAIRVDVGAEVVSIPVGDVVHLRPSG